MPARALSMPPWVRTITPDIPAGGGTTDAAQADTAAPQAQDRESETPEDSNDSGNDDEGDPEPADEPAGDVAVWKKYARTWETRAKENKKTADTLQAQLDAETGKTKQAEEALAEATKRQQAAENTAAYSPRERR